MSVAWRTIGWSWRRHGVTTVGAILVGWCVVVAAAAPLIVPFSPYDLDVVQMLQAPSRTHWLGTDEVGRDVLSRTIYAARISIEVAFVAVGVGFGVGTLLGLCGSLFRRSYRCRVDAVYGASVFLSCHIARCCFDGEPWHQYPQCDDSDRDHLHSRLCAIGPSVRDGRTAPAIY